MSSSRTTIQAPLTERIVAAIIDFVIVCGLCMFPRIGWIIGIIYHLTRDSLPFLNGQSFGKRLMNIKTIKLPDQLPLTGSPEKSIIRGIVFLIPILNLIDIWHLVTKGLRLADKWAETDVIIYRGENN